MSTAARLMAVAYDDLCRATLKLAPLMAGKAFVAPGEGNASPTTGILGETRCRHCFRESQLCRLQGDLMSGTGAIGENAPNEANCDEI